MDTPQLRFATCGHVVVAAVAAALCNVFMGRPEKNGKKRKREKGRRRWRSRARGSNGKSHKKRAIGPVYVSTAAAAATKRKTGIALAVVVVVGRSCRAALRCFHLYCIYKIHTQTYAYLHT